MSAYVQHLSDLARRSQEARAKAKAALAQEEASERLKPLVDRLSRLLQEVPLEEQRAGLSLMTLRSRLRGRRRGLAHVGEVGLALRQLGYKRCRVWGGDRPLGAIWRKVS
jgi:hypothetical protein